jgi:endonuclease/exonuclease/phosphatase family metal-dependent hydrolase
MVSLIILSTFFRFFSWLDDPRPSVAEIHRVAGSPADHASADDKSELKIVSWNIQFGLNFQQIADTLRGLGADVILLQEADRFCGRTGARDVPHDLARALGMNWVSGGEFQELGESKGGVPALTGQAILSRYPIADPRVIVFEDQARLRWHFNPFQPRRGGRIALSARINGVLFYNVHIESGGNDRLRRNQLEQALVDADRQRETRVVLAGDFNNVAPERSLMFQSLTSRHFLNARGQENQPTHVRHAFPIDWIFAKGLLAISGVVVRIEHISDHYPVVATLRPLEE